MSVSPFLLRHQGAMLATLGKVIVSSIGSPTKGELPDAPGEWIEREIAAPPEGLIDSYAYWCGAPQGRYDGIIPPHMFPQWAFPLASKTIGKLPYKLTGVLNQGCAIKVGAPLPRGERLQLRARLEAIEDDGSKVRIHQRVITGTRDNPDALTSDIFAVLVHSRKKGGKKRKEAEPKYETVGEWSAAAGDGRRFAILTGDLNPIHWIKPYAKMAGFKATILHGFGTFARTCEVLRNELGGDIVEADVRFVAPLNMPADLTVQISKAGKSKPSSLRVIDSDDRTCMVGTVRMEG